MGSVHGTLDHALHTRAQLILRLARWVLLLACGISLGIDLLENPAWLLTTVLRTTQLLGALLMLELCLRSVVWWRLLLALSFAWLGFTDAFLNALSLSEGVAAMGASLVVVATGLFPARLGEATFRTTVATLAVLLGLWLGGQQESGALLMPISVMGVGIVLSYVHYRVEEQSWRLREEAIQISEVRRLAEEVRSRFLARMSHELRTPLHGILGMLHAAQGRPLEPEQAEALQTAQQSGTLMLAMIEDVLLFAAGEREGVELDAAATALVPLVQRALAALQIERPAPTLRLVLSDPPPPTVWVDPRRLQQILYKLVSNAQRFSPEGEGEVTVSLQWDDPSTCLTLEVVDCGPGLPTDLQTLLAPFSQADTSSTRAHDGMGLGLALVDQIVRAMGGTISAENRVDRSGTRVRVQLSLLLASPPVPAVTTMTTTTPTPVSGRVLIVDDNRINRAVLRRMVQALGVEGIDEAEDGLGGLERMRAWAYPLVLMDHHMPVMDGLEATRQARAEGFAGAIVAVTAAPPAEARAACLEAGMNEHLSKPVSPQLFAQIAARYLSSPPAAQAKSG